MSLPLGWAEQGWVEHPRLHGMAQHPASGAIQFLPLGDDEPTFEELMRSSDNEELWEWYQFDQRLHGWFAPSNHLLRRELLKRIGCCP